MTDLPAAMKRDAATVAELRKRIGELEDDRRTDKLALTMCSNECNRLYEDYSKQGDALAAERQRREEAEATIRGIAWSLQFEPTSDAKDLAREYLAHYPSESDNPLKVAE